MKFRYIVMFLFLSGQASAADGVGFTHNKPANAPTPKYSCMDVCDKTDQDGSLECGPIWPPIPNSTFSEFKVIGDSSDCPFDAIDVMPWDTATAPSGEHVVVFGTLDDDSGCGSGGISACNSVRVDGPIFGFVYLKSTATVGSATCASFKVRLCQLHPTR